MATILVVDDERPLRDLLVALFEQAGHRVLQAGDGRTALELVATERPDAVISDVMMPAIDGAELCRRLKASDETRALPVVLVTAADTRHAAGAGADALLSKPFDLDVLEALLARLLSERGVRP